MRKTIIIALLLIVSSFAFCQTKSDTAKKQPVKQFVPDLTKTITLQVKLPLYQVDNYIYTLQNPDYTNRDDLSGKRINGITVNAQAAFKAIIDSLIVSYNRGIAAQQKAFTDTSKTKPDKIKR